MPDKDVSQEFANDCLIWMLFNNANLTAGANDLQWQGKKWSLINHFIPFQEDEVGAPSRFESDFMFQYISSLKISKEARKVLNDGRKVWSSYFEAVDRKQIPKFVREKYKLNRPDVGWYQIRNTLDLLIGQGTNVSHRASDIETSYKALSVKIEPSIYSTGILRA